MTDPTLTTDAVAFSITNQNGSQSLVAGAVNTLTLTLTNNTASPITLKGGAILPEKDAPSGPSSLYLNFGDLFDDVPSEALTISADHWTPAKDDWAIARDDDFQLGAGTTQTFTIANVQAPANPRPGQLTIDYYNIGSQTGSAGLALPVQKSATGHDKPDLGAAWVGSNVVTITTDPANPIQNTLSFTVTNASRTSPIVPPTVPWGTAPPVFQLWFACGEAPGYGALTTSALAAGIQVAQSTQYGDTWKPVPNTQASPPYWDLLPQEHEVLGTNESASVQLTVSNIVTALQPGITVLYLQYANLPGYDDGFVSPALTIEKVLPARIGGFSADRHFINFDSGGTTITLSWEAEHARRLTISNTGHVDTSPVPTTLSGSLAVTVQEPTVYTLQASAGTVDDGPTQSVQILRLQDYLTGNTLPLTGGDGWQQPGEYGEEFFSVSIGGQVSFPSVGAANVAASMTGSRRFPYVDPDGKSEMDYADLDPQSASRSGTWRVSGYDVYVDTPQGTVHLLFSEWNGQGRLELGTPLFNVWGHDSPWAH